VLRFFSGLDDAWWSPALLQLLQWPPPEQAGLSSGSSPSSASEAARFLNEAIALRQSGHGMLPAIPGTS